MRGTNRPNRNPKPKPDTQKECNINGNEVPMKLWSNAAKEKRIYGEK